MDEKDLATLYKNRFPERGLARKNEIWKVICKNYFQKFVGRNDTVVDLACGYGEFINNISAGEKVAVDLNRESRQHLSAGIRFEQVNATELATVLEGQVDVVFTSNFLEHLPDKKTLEVLLDQILLSLRPGGAFPDHGPQPALSAGGILGLLRSSFGADAPIAM